MAQRKTKKKKNSKDKKKTKPAKKKITKKRDKASYPGLVKNLFSKKKQEYHDIDYADKLNDKQKKMLSQFMEEWLGARLNGESKKKFHSTAKRRKQVYDMNNARERDIYSLMRATGRLDNMSYTELANVLDQSLDNVDPSGYEDMFIEMLDKKMGKT